MKTIDSERLFTVNAQGEMEISASDLDGLCDLVKLYIMLRCLIPADPRFAPHIEIGSCAVREQLCCELAGCFNQADKLVLSDDDHAELANAFAECEYSFAKIARDYAVAWQEKTAAPIGSWVKKGDCAFER